MVKEQKRANRSSFKKLDDDEFWIKPDRLVALTDGVFAITMTLLVLELHAVEIMTHFENTGLFEIYVYFIGFLSLGVYWALHHYKNIKIRQEFQRFAKRHGLTLLEMDLMLLGVSFGSKLLGYDRIRVDDDANFGTGNDEPGIDGWLTNGKRWFPSDLVDTALLAQGLPTAQGLSLLAQVHLQVEAHPLAARRQPRDLKARQRQVLVGQVQQLKHNLDQRTAADMTFRLQLFDQLLERHLLVRGSIEGGPPDPLQRFPEGHGRMKARAQDEGVDE